MYVLELGGDDDAFAAAEAAAAATDVRVVAPAIAVASDVDCERFRGLAYAHRAGEQVATAAASVDAAADALRDADLDREGSVAVRARDVRGTAGVDTQRAERELGGVPVDRGFSVDLEDPDHELRALYSRDSAHLS